MEPVRAFHQAAATIKVALEKQQFVEVDDEAGNTGGKFMISNR